MNGYMGIADTYYSIYAWAQIKRNIVRKERTNKQRLTQSNNQKPSKLGSVSQN